ncbi:hypothetical protein P279_10950 [Rhodobacteraceae bacterium PD-2]|nr:hypothetical protein P279_10950 [Rhodobacteraceae bacterium PD-2]
MTATAPRTDRAPRADSPRAPNFLVRVLLAVLGGALTLAAFGLWLVPVSGGMPMLFLPKLGISLVMLIAGMCFVVVGRGPRG